MIYYQLSEQQDDIHPCLECLELGKLAPRHTLVQCWIYRSAGTPRMHALLVNWWPAKNGQAIYWCFSSSSSLSFICTVQCAVCSASVHCCCWCTVLHVSHSIHASWSGHWCWGPAGTAHGPWAMRHARFNQATVVAPGRLPLPSYQPTTIRTLSASIASLACLLSDVAATDSFDGFWFFFFKKNNGLCHVH